MEERIKKIEEELGIIKVRNSRVEADKAWETSYFRIFLICGVTYVIAFKILYFIGSKNYFLDALIPTIGYFLSVQSMPFIKKWWVEDHFKDINI